MSVKKISIGDNIYRLSYEEFDNINIDDLLKIDYSNIIGELITFPIIVNRFGLLLADAESQVSELKLNIDVYEAKIKEKIRLKLTEQNKGKNPTVDALSSAVLQDRGFQALRKRLIEVQKIRDYMNSVFWSAKDKSEKLNKLSLTIQNNDVPDDILEGKINNILIKKDKKLID
jgi:hypothetical protein